MLTGQSLIVYWPAFVSSELSYESGHKEGGLLHVLSILWKRNTR